MTNKKSCLITYSLVNAIEWYLDAPDKIIKPEKGGDGKTTWKEKALIDLSNLLNRVEGVFPEAARKGVEFEKLVYKKASSEEFQANPKGSPQFQQVCKEVQGFTFYKKSGIYLPINNKDTCYLFCKYDAVRYSGNAEKKIEEIKDIKTTENYSSGKYIKTFQHKLYLYVSGATKFEYIIAEWEDYPKIKCVYKEVINLSDIEDLEEEVHYKISQVLNLIKSLGLWEAYINKFCLY